MGRTVAWTPEQASRFVASTFLGVAGLWNGYSRDDPLVQERAIAGIVVDSAGVPVPWANVTLNGGRRVVTGLDGRFRFRGDSIASATVEVRRIGFHPAAVMVNTWPDTGVRLVLTAVPHSLSAVRVGVARIQSLVSHGFYDRMSEVEKGIGHGYFITPEEMAARPSARVTDLVSRLPAIRIRRIRETTRTGQYGMQIQGVDGCRMTIYVDGIRFYHVDPTRALKPGEGFIDDLVSSNTIAGIEVYPRAVGAPPKYQSLNGTCGVVLIWTR